MNIELRIDEVDSRPGYQWCFCDSNGEILTTPVNYLTAQFAVQAGKKLAESFSNNEWRIIDYLKKNEGYILLETHVSYLFQDSEWGHYAHIVDDGPLAFIACTYYHSSKDELTKLLEKIFGGITIVHTTI